MLRASIPTTIEIRQNIDTRCGSVMADPVQIHQVLMNLCTNAYQAMEEYGGVLEVYLDRVDIDADFARQNANLKEGSYIRLTVRDTGTGMDEETMEHIFEPFFTTKGIGKGTGLGLSVVHGIVESIGGMITVNSTQGKGSVFNVFFPRIETDGASEKETIKEFLMGKESILFVDDEESIVDMVKQMLERLGYQVVVKTSSIEALKCFKEQPHRFDLVIADVIMPKLRGEMLARELMRIRPDIPVILCTGFTERITKEKAKEIGIRDVIMKPITMREIAQSIREVLNHNVIH
jgi:CheY-like chemotaxis protein